MKMVGRLISQSVCLEANTQCTSERGEYVGKHFKGANPISVYVSSMQKVTTLITSAYPRCQGFRKRKTAGFGKIAQQFFTEESSSQVSVTLTPGNLMLSSGHT